MASAAQTAANRRNALKSTGPRSAEGKQASSVNAVKHGLYSSLDSLAPKQRADFDGCFQHHFQTWNAPSDDEAHRLIREIALADYRRESIRGNIFSLMENERDVMRNEIDRQLGIDTPDDMRDAAVLQHDFLHRNVIAKLFKLENSFSRQMDKSTRELRARLALLAAEPVQTDEPAELQLPAVETEETNPIHARSGPCTCGSGEKYKRCCGNDAPPQLQPGAHAA